MCSMEWWTKKQTMMTKLNIELEKLYNEKIELMNHLIKISKMIEKHENYLEQLKDEDVE